jgi:hypothetical protein
MLISLYKKDADDTLPPNEGGGSDDTYAKLYDVVFLFEPPP